MLARSCTPPTPGSPGHDLWKRDFVGASGLFSVRLPEAAEARLETALDGLTGCSAIGASWGGTRSLIAPHDPDARDGRGPWPHTYVRVGVGLEDPADLRADLAAFFAILA